MDTRQHWEKIYTTRRATEVSWFQTDPHRSLAFIRRVAPDVHSAIADVGGGASTLVDALLQAGYHALTVLDISAAALAQSRDRLADSAGKVNWLVANALEPALPRAGIDFWHDRAVFHFLTDPRDRERYIEQVRRALRPGGYVLIATFAEDGPKKCSGLNVTRYSTSALKAEFGDQFELVDHDREDHVTPAGVHQSFQYCLLRYLAVLCISLVLAACSTTPGTSDATRAASPPQALTPALRNASIDSVVEFLLTSAASDFRLHGPSGPLRFREVRIGHIVTPDSGKQYRLCGQFLRVAEEGKAQWTPFVTIKTSGYEQLIGGSSYCQDSLVIWDTGGDLSSALQSRFDSLR